MRNLLVAYLELQEESTLPIADLAFDHLWEKCVARSPEILPLAANVGLFLNESVSITTEEEAEILLDAANELWDFIFASLPE